MIVKKTVYYSKTLDKNFDTEAEAIAAEARHNEIEEMKAHLRTLLDCLEGASLSSYEKDEVAQLLAPLVSRYREPVALKTLTERYNAATGLELPEDSFVTLLNLFWISEKV